MEARQLEIENHHLVPVLLQFVAVVAPEESRASGHDELHLVPVTRLYSFTSWSRVSIRPSIAVW